jgi:methylene-tetrahydromethanopterin dehydrogenase
MEKPFLLHLITPTPQASPFDVNMAYDAGFNAVIPYTNVSLGDVANLTQDAIFSRGPKGVRRTGIFIGGREIGLAADMLDTAKKAMFPPFEVSVFADPSGAFTTAAALVAAVERKLAKHHNRGLDGLDVAVMGGTGPVGAAAAVLVSSAGGRARIASHSSGARAQMTSQVVNARYGSATQSADASSGDLIDALITEADVVLACAKAGVQVLSKEQLSRAPKLLVAADVNAVPPAGIEGVGMTDDGVPLATASGKTVGIGALAVGNIKYQVMKALFESMLRSDKAVFLDFRDAFAAARSLAPE